MIDIYIFEMPKRDGVTVEHTCMDRLEAEQFQIDHPEAIPEDMSNWTESMMEGWLVMIKGGKK